MRGCAEVGSNLARRNGVRAPNCPYCGPVEGVDDVFGGGQVGLPHLEVDGVGILPGELRDLAYAPDGHGAGDRRGRRGHLTGSGGDLLRGQWASSSVCAAPGIRLAGQAHIPRFRTKVALALERPCQAFFLGTLGGRQRARWTHSSPSPLARVAERILPLLSCCAAGSVVLSSQRCACHAIGGSLAEQRIEPVWEVGEHPVDAKVD